MVQQPLERQTYTPAEVATILHRARSTIYSFIRRNQINVVHIGGRLLVTQAELDRLLTEGISGKSYDPLPPGTG